MAIQYAFMNTVQYDTSALNALRGTLTTSGVAPDTIDACKVVTGSGPGRVKVLPGTAFFSDGTRITVDNAGYEIAYPAGSACYIFFLNSQTANKCEVLAATALPSGDYVMLASITAGGGILDKREYAKCKIPSFERNWDVTRNFSIWVSIPAQANGVDGVKNYDIRIGTGDFHIYAFRGKGTATTDITQTWYDAQTGLYCNCFHNKAVTDSTRGVIVYRPLYTEDCYLYFTVSRPDNQTVRLSFVNPNTFTARPYIYMTVEK